MIHGAKYLNLHSDIPQDWRTRISVPGLLKETAGDRLVLKKVVYGSEPPQFRDAWATGDFEDKVSKKSTYSGKEREVDQNIMLDLGSDLELYQNLAARNLMTIIIMTGDGGMFAAVERALENNYNVKLWTYKNSCAQNYKDLRDKRENTKPEFSITYMDEFFKSVAYYELKWNSDDGVPKERTLVITLQKKYDEDKLFLNAVVETITDLLKIPMLGKYIEDKNSNKITHIALVCAVKQSFLIEPNKIDNKNNKEKSFAFNKEQWQDFLSIVPLSQTEQSDSSSVKLKVEELIQNVLKKKSSGQFKVDFNTEVYQKIENAIKANSKDDGKWHQNIGKYKPTLKSYVLFCQDDRHLDNGQEILYAPGEDDIEHEEPFNLPQTSQRGKAAPLFSESCKYSFNCRNGKNKCEYSHSNEEIQFFKMYKNPMKRCGYKSKLCDYYLQGKCNFKPPNTYLCKFAHGTYCSTCKKDDEGGHDLARCVAANK